MSSNIGGGGSAYLNSQATQEIRQLLAGIDGTSSLGATNANSSTLIRQLMQDASNPQSAQQLAQAIERDPGILQQLPPGLAKHLLHKLEKHDPASALKLQQLGQSINVPPTGPGQTQPGLMA